MLGGIPQRLPTGRRLAAGDKRPGPTALDEVGPVELDPVAAEVVHLAGRCRRRVSVAGHAGRDGQAAETPAQRGLVLELTVDRRTLPERPSGRLECAELYPRPAGQEREGGHSLGVPGLEGCAVAGNGELLGLSQLAGRFVAEDPSDPMGLGYLGGSLAATGDLDASLGHRERLRGSAEKGERDRRGREAATCSDVVTRLDRGLRIVERGRRDRRRTAVSSPLARRAVPPPASGR